VPNEATGLYENDYYTWDPVTRQTTPKTPQSYSYNPNTGMWDTTEWRYDAASGKYAPNVTSVSSLAGVNANIEDTGPNSTNGINLANGQDGTFNGFYNASISNNLSSLAMSGNVMVNGNTLAGNAMSGDATGITNVLNLLQSSMGAGQDIATFSTDLNGNMVGDLLIDPSVLRSLQPASNQVAGNSTLTVNSDANGHIANNVAVNADTGNATVDSNTTAGNATTGNANAVANIVNMINSLISSGKSFVGNININGNLDGDILLPPDVLNALLASNGSSAPGQSLTANTNTTDVINNNVQTGATTGNANVAGNTVAGNATTGNARTNVTILNLTGRNVIGKNALLVFVNVLGRWVGMIMDAPGSTAAALGGGITDSSTSDTTINANTHNQIDNNVNVNANSGDAAVTNNTNAGNATTGNATASANLANITSSQLSLADWFGILFINVFGTWNGSFGVNTSAGNPSLPPVPSSSVAASSAPQVFQFVPGDSEAPARFVHANTSIFIFGSLETESASSGSSASQDNPPVVLASSHPSGHGVSQLPATQLSSSTHRDWTLPIIGAGISFILLGLDQFISRRRAS
jgi:hypothetical protein